MNKYSLGLFLGMFVLALLWVATDRFASPTQNLIGSSDVTVQQTAPGVTNDISEGYLPGYVWVDQTGGAVYITEDTALGAAIWTDVTAGGSTFNAEEIDGLITANVSVLDFGLGFDLTDSPAGETNVVLNYTEDPIDFSGAEVIGTLDLSDHVNLAVSGDGLSLVGDTVTLDLAHPTVYVCASNITDTTHCDYIADGTDDDVQIQAAIDGLSGGRDWIETVYALGDFTIGDHIELASYTRLWGYDARFTIDAGVDATMFRNLNRSDPGTDNNIEIYGGIYDGADEGSGKELIAFTRVYDWKIIDVEVLQASGNGITIAGVATGEGGTGQAADRTRPSWFLNVNSHDNGQDGAYIRRAARNVKVDAYYGWNNTRHGIVFDTSEANIGTVIANRNGARGFYYTNGHSNTIEQIIATRNGEHNVLFRAADTTSVNGIIARGASQNTEHGADLNTGLQWTASGSGTSEYYLEASGGGDPSILEPFGIEDDGVLVFDRQNALGSLAAGDIGFGDNDTLGFDAVYVRLTDSSDPDASTITAFGWVEVMFDHTHGTHGVNDQILIGNVLTSQDNNLRGADVGSDNVAVGLAWPTDWSSYSLFFTESADGDPNGEGGTISAESDNIYVLGDIEAMAEGLVREPPIVGIRNLNVIYSDPARDRLQLYGKRTLRLYEDEANGDNYVELDAPASLGADVSLTWNITTATCTGDGNAGALTINGSDEIVCSADDSAGNAYNIIEDEGAPLTARTTVNFIGTGVSCVDNGGGAQTDCTISSGGGSGTLTTIKDSTSQVGDADIVALDFGDGITCSESPDTEVNCSVDLGTSIDLTAEVTGTLPVANGGTGQTAATADGFLVGDGSVFAVSVAPDCNAAGNALQYDTTTDALSCATGYLATVDISADTNLVAGTGITLTDDTLSVDLGTDIDLSGAEVTGTLDLSDHVNLTAGDGLTLTGDEVSADVTTFQFNWTLLEPVDADSYLVAKLQNAITITDIHCIVDPADAAESVVIDIQETNSTGDSGVTVDATITCDNDGAEDDGALTNGPFDAGDHILWDIGTVTGTVSAVTVTVYYTID